jgi:hypothetical protein
MRNIEIRATAKSREAIERYLFAGYETTALGFGGSRYGAKTWTGAQIMGYRRLMYENTRGLCLRTVQRAADLNLGEEIKNAFFKTHGIPVGKRSNGGVAYLEADKRFVLPNGSLIQIAYCRLESDWEQHLGLQWDDIWFEQAEQTKEKMYDKFLGSNRPNNPDCIPRMLLTFNPGGVGQDWIMKRIVDPETRDKRTAYVKSTVRECVSTLERDPSYIPQKLMKIRDPVTRKRWLDGDWDIINGSFFILPDKTVREVVVPRHAEWHGSTDYGYSKPFAYLITAFFNDDKGNPHLHVVDMVYRAKLDTDTQAQFALEKEEEVRVYMKGAFKEVEFRLADPATGTPAPRESEEQSKAIADQWRDNGLYTYPAGKYSRPARWALIRRLLNRGILTISPRCVELIAEFKRAVQMEDRDDIDQKKCNDHALDALAYIVCHLFGLNYGASTEIVDGYGRPLELVGADERAYA